MSKLKYIFLLVFPLLFILSLVFYNLSQSVKVVYGTTASPTPTPCVGIASETNHENEGCQTPSPTPTLTPVPTPCDDVEECPQPTATPTPVPCGEDQEDSEPCPTSTPTPGPTNPPNNPPNDGPHDAPVCTDTKPATTVLRSVSKVNSTSVVLNWDKIPGANTYVILYGTSKDNYQFGVASTGEVDTFTVGNLDPNVNYCFRVRATRGCNASDVSNEICLSGQVLGAKRGEVLGVSTLAPTGNSLANMGSLGQNIGLLLILGGITYANKETIKKSLQKKFS